MKAVRRLLAVLAFTLVGVVATGGPASAAITVRMEVTKVPQGQWAYATGKTDVGQKIVFVQRWNGSRWYDITGAAVKADGTFRASLKPKDPGTYTFRVRSKQGSVLSKVFYLKVTPVRPPVPVYLSIVPGHGSFTSKDFKVPSTWRFGWSAANTGFICVFDVYADYTDGRTAHLAHTTVGDLLGDGGYSIARNAAGTMRVVVVSDCDTWTIRLQGV